METPMPTARDLFESKKTDKQDKPEIWKGITGDAKPGDTLYGKVLEISEGIRVRSQFGETERTVVRILDEDDETEKVVWLSRTVLIDAWLKADPQVGDLVMIHYVGTKPTRNGEGEYHIYQVLKHTTEFGHPKPSF